MDETPFNPAWTRAAGNWPIDLTADPFLRKSFDLARTKWNEVPYGKYGRRRSSEMLALPDAEFLAVWDASYEQCEPGASWCGWYRTLYRDVFRGKKVLDVGCGMGIDTVFYAQHGAQVTALDVTPDNIGYVQRVCRLKSIECVRFLVMEDLLSLEALPGDFDFIYCCGSMHHAPLEVARLESQALLKLLAPAGRWVALGYPKTRWVREGELKPQDWGTRTDGWAPWVEWHDLEKLDYLLAPAAFDVVLNLEFNNSDFVWFDLARRT